MTILRIWTAPFLTSNINKEEDYFSIKARSFLGIDTLEAQGLLKECFDTKETKKEDNLIHIIVSLTAKASALTEIQYLEILRDCVYSNEKAVQVR